MMPFGRISKYTAPATPAQSVKLQKSEMGQTLLKMPRISNFKSEPKIESQEKMSEHHEHHEEQILVDKSVDLQEEVAAVNLKGPVIHVVHKYGRKHKNNEGHEENVHVNNEVIYTNPIKEEQRPVIQQKHSIDRRVPIFKKSKQLLANHNNQNDFEDPQKLSQSNNFQQPIQDPNVNNLQETQLQNKQSLSVHLDQQNQVYQSYEKQLAIREFKERQVDEDNGQIYGANAVIGQTLMNLQINKSMEHEVKNEPDSAQFHSVLSSQQIKQNQSNFSNHSSQMRPNMTESVNQNYNDYQAQKEVYSPTREFQVHTLPSFEPIEIPINS